MHSPDKYSFIIAPPDQVSNQVCVYGLFSAVRSDSVLKEKKTILAADTKGESIAKKLFSKKTCFICFDKHGSKWQSLWAQVDPVFQSTQAAS